MSDRLFFPLATLAMLAMVGLALIFPQGDGRRSPAPFGHETTAEAAARAPRLRPALTPRPAKPGFL